MIRLSSPIASLPPHAPVVVVGSGYGGAVAASRLARAGQRVCVLERGRELWPGEYPRSELDVLASFQVRAGGSRLGRRTALFDFRVGDDVSVFMGCGLGGGSLVNAAVAVEPDADVLGDAAWPDELRQPGALEEGFRRARQMLAPAVCPRTDALRKHAVLGKVASAIGGTLEPAELNITFEEPAGGLNRFGVEQHACTDCGDCVAGCNDAAKNSLLMNYLPDAKAHGAEIFTGVAVHHLARRGQVWELHLELLESDAETGSADRVITADVVVLAAGALGSTEILLRSRPAVTLSERLGKGVTGNGDVLGFAYSTGEDVNGVGFGVRSSEGREPVGPTITGLVRRPDVKVLIEEGALPGSIAGFAPLGLAAAAATLGTPRVPTAEQLSRQLDSLVFGPYSGAVRNTLTYLVMAHDGADGELTLDPGGHVELHGASLAGHPILDRISDLLTEATTRLDGIYVPSPGWMNGDFSRRGLVTVQPLGGCRMASDARDGVVNHKGAVFAGTQGAAVHDGLYVLDGAVMPRSLGVNPLLTITALAERACLIMARDRGWTVDDAPPTPLPRTPAAHTAGIEFTETMRGELTRDGETSPFAFTLTMTADDFEAMLADPEHRFRASGTVTAPGLSARVLAVRAGTFSLFAPDPDHVETRLMRYQLLLADAGRSYTFTGVKRIHDDPGNDVLTDTTRLTFEIHDGGEGGPCLGHGWLALDACDVMAQVGAIRVPRASAAQALRIKARFGAFFLGQLYTTYGGVFAPASVVDSRAPVRPRRPLRLPPPSVYRVRVPGAELRATRYNGGGDARYPVALSPGFGMTPGGFLADTIETNLTEYLVTHGHDVWLLEYRSSTALAAAASAYTIDDIARHDYPALVDTMLQHTGAEQVQILAHCVGSMSLLMSLLAGHLAPERVRSVICSQVTSHPVPQALVALKTRLPIAALLERLGVKTLSTAFDAGADSPSWLLELAMRLYPTRERCRNPVCRRILFMYGETHHHAQLNEATHRHLHEMWGVASMSALRHLSRILGGGKTVNAEGRDDYLPAHDPAPNLRRLALPITFVHGTKNHFFLLRGSERTYEALRAVNPPSLYRLRTLHGYSHLDCFIGRNAAREVYPVFLEELARFNPTTGLVPHAPFPLASLRLQ